MSIPQKTQCSILYARYLSQRGSTLRLIDNGANYLISQFSKVDRTFFDKDAVPHFDSRNILILEYSIRDLRDILVDMIYHAVDLQHRLF